MSYDLNQYLVREYEKLDSELEQREFVEKMRFLMMAKEKDFSGYYSRRNLAGREFYSVIDTLYELNNLWMLSGFIRQNHQVLFQETRFISGNTERHRIPKETGFYGNQQDWERHHAVPDVPGHGKVPYG